MAAKKSKRKVSKAKAKARRILARVGHELKRKPPAILKKTKRRKGAKAAEKQRTAILLAKARAAGAAIPAAQRNPTPRNYTLRQVEKLLRAGKRIMVGVVR